MQSAGRQRSCSPLPPISKVLPTWPAVQAIVNARVLAHRWLELGLKVAIAAPKFPGFGTSETRQSMHDAVSRLRSAIIALALSPDSAHDRFRRLAATILQVALVVLGFLAGTLGLTFYVIPAVGDSVASRVCLATLVGSAYAGCYLAVARVERRAPAVWSSVALVVLELILLAILLPYLVDLAAALAPPAVVQRLASGDNELVELTGVLALVLLGVRGWARHVQASARARIATETAALYERLAMEDTLTGLANRRQFEHRMGLRDWTSVHLLMVDVDRFKRINDGHSHQIGDEVLKRIAVVLRTGIRSSDFAARLAGDEFVVALFNLDDASAEATAARLKQAVLAQPWHDVAPSLKASISVGVTRGEADSEFAEVLRQSDMAMYRDKASLCVGEASLTNP